MSGCSLASHGGTYQWMMPIVAGRAEVLGAAVTRVGEELLLQVGVAPVLEHDVDLAGAEALPGDVLLEVLVVDLAAELLLGDVADDVGVRLVADPRVDRDVELAAVALAGRGLVLLGLFVDRAPAAARERASTAHAASATSRPAFCLSSSSLSPADSTRTLPPRWGLLFVVLLTCRVRVATTALGSGSTVLRARRQRARCGRS